MKHTLACTISALLISSGVFADATAPLSKESAGAFLVALKEAKENFLASPPPPPPPPPQPERPQPGPDGTIAPQPPPAPPQPRFELDKAVFFIYDSRIRSCGFVVNLWGKTVLVTSANTFARMQNPTVENARRERFELLSALTGKNMDLALLELKNIPEDLVPFQIPENPTYKVEDNISVSGEQPNNVRTLYTTQVQITQIRAGASKDSVRIILTSPTQTITSGGPAFTAEGGNSGKNTTSGSNKICGILIQDWEDCSLNNIFNGYGTFYFESLDNLNPDDFECFDKTAQEKDLQFYASAEPVLQRCIREYSNPHYSWTLYGRTTSGGKHDYSQINTYLYCHSMFPRINFLEYFAYKPSLRILQRVLNQQQKKFIALSYLFHVLPINLTPEEITFTQRLYNTLQSNYRRNKFVCRQCGGTGREGRVAGFESKGIRIITCNHCHGIGTANVVYYGPLRVSPFPWYPRSSYEFSGFRIGMDFNMANKVADEDWRRDTAQYNITNFNGLVDVVNVGRNPEYSNRALRTRLKFMARRLMSIEVFFENDQHNFQTMYDTLRKTFGSPGYELHAPGWTYVLFYGHDVSALLTTEGGKVVVRIYSRILQQLEAMLLETFEQTLFSPPLKDYDGVLYYPI